MRLWPEIEGSDVNEFATTDSSAQPAVGVPCVSILIPVHNRLDLTRACIDSVFATAETSITFEILVIDDNSTDGTAEHLKALGTRIRTIRNDTRGCFGHNINLAAPLARGEYLCLLNNDTLVTVGWLTKLVAAARRDAAIGIVGNRHLTPGTNLLNHAGMVFDTQGYPHHLYPGQPADFPPALVSREFQILTAACWLIEKQLFVDLGGFDPQFKNGFEDVDFCLRVRQSGRKVFYAADSVIYHYGQSTPGREDNDFSNARYFKRKWGTVIASDINNVGDAAERKPELTSDRAAANRMRQAPAIVHGNSDLHFATPLNQANAFSWVISKLALASDDAGVAISLQEGGIHHSIEPSDRRRLERMMTRRPSGRAQVRWAHFWPPYFEQPLSGRINAELFAHNYRYGPRSLEQLDYWMRHTVTNQFRKLPAAKYCSDALEELGVPSRRCRTVPYGYAPEIEQYATANDEYRRRGFVFLAVTNSNDPWRYGTDILLNAFDRAFAGRKDVLLVLKDYGSNAGGLVRKWADAIAGRSQIFHVDVFMEKRELIELYRGADAFVAPFRGEGFGMKILDACAVGLPILAPQYGGPADYLNPGDFFSLKYKEVPVGPCLDREETALPDFAVWAEVDCNDLAQQLKMVAEDQHEARRRAARCRDFVLQNFSWRRAAQRLEIAIGEFEKEREQIVWTRSQVVESKKLSVVIPTYDRKAELTTCLQAYEQQTLPKDQWEMLLVDDGSNYDVGSTVSPFEKSLPLRMLFNGSNKGPGIARNLGLAHAAGKVVVFAGDDIIPGARFLEQHLAAHERCAEPAFAVVGHIAWHPSVKVTPLMEFVTGDGGQQFAFNRLVPNSLVSPGFFYTSNVSVKRALVFEQEELFSERFRLVALEDGEFGYRLAQSGMKLFYIPSVSATHLHPMSDQYIYQRQYRVGRMLVTYACLHPDVIDRRHRETIRWLEMFQHLMTHDNNDPTHSSARRTEDLWPDDFVEQLFRLGAAEGGMAPAWAAQKLRWMADTTAGLKNQVFKLRLERELLDGMADEWFGVDPGSANPGREFLRGILYAEILKPGVLGPSYDSHWPDRFAYIERLRTKRPIASSLLRSLVRLATGIAKRLN
jgi:GT2 family glycosyltransferase/glycosyltransferase involved in cell wall biosynthesis